MVSDESVRGTNWRRGDDDLELLLAITAVLSDQLCPTQRELERRLFIL